MPDTLGLVQPWIIFLFRSFTLNLLLVASVTFGHEGNAEVSHAMVLDTFDPKSDMLIFKNTYDQEGQPKQVKISRTDPNGPEELYFVHMEIKDMDYLPDQEERSYLIKKTSLFWLLWTLGLTNLLYSFRNQKNVK